MSEQALAWFAALDPKVLTHAEFRVLNRLAWHHNDEDNCAWPSYKYLIAKTGMSKGGLSKCMDRLEEKGLIQRQQRENASTLYYLNFGFAQETGVHSVNGSGSLSEPQGVRSVGYNKDTSKKHSSKKDEVFHALFSVAQNEDAVRSFMAYRTKAKKPLSLTAAKRQATELQKIATAGFDPADALGEAEERGWQAVKAEWIINARNRDNDNRNRNHIGNNPKAPNGGAGSAHHSLLAGFAAHAHRNSGGA